MSRPVPIQAAWSKVNIMSFDEPVALSNVELADVLGP
jgi:hypothetical protein